MTKEQQVALDCARIADRYHGLDPDGHIHCLPHYAIMSKYFGSGEIPSLPGANEPRPCERNELSIPD